MDAAASVTKEHAGGKILHTVSDGVGVLTFNHPEKRNAMSIEMWEAAGHVLETMRDDPSVRVVVMVGAGGKAFISGADISQFEKNRHNAEAAEEYSRRSGAPRRVLAEYPKPTSVCIGGFCIGGGLAMAMSADIRIASDDSQFGIPAAKLGIAYGYDGLRNLEQLVGPAWARLLMFTGMRIDAYEAVRIGLVERIHPAKDLWTATMEVARSISGNAPLAVYAAKLTISEVLKDRQDRDMEAIRNIGDVCMDSDDFREGRRAFMEKRKPTFTGK